MKISSTLLYFTLTLLITLSVNSAAQTSQKNESIVAKEKSATARRPIIEVGRSSSRTETKTAPPKPIAELVTSVELISQLERRAFEMLNEQRRKNGLPPIQFSEDMAKVARQHSENMAKYNFFSHAGLDGKMVNERADELGFSKWRAIGENIAYNRGYDDPVEFCYQRWMQSPSHRENILSPRWKEAGIGVAVTTEGAYYFTQVFVLKY